jgi:hypothetical protein
MKFQKINIYNYFKNIKYYAPDKIGGIFKGLININIWRRVALIISSIRKNKRIYLIQRVKYCAISAKYTYHFCENTNVRNEYKSG